MRKEILITFLLFTVVAVCYSTVFDAQFVWDDELIVFRNPLIRAPLNSFAIFKQDIINSSFVHTVYYRPIQILSYAVDYRIWGMRAFAFHFTNILLHFFNVLLVFFLTYKIIKERTDIAFLTAVLFAAHPAFLAAASYISGRADLLFFLFGFLSIYSFIIFTEKRCYRYFVFHILFLTLSLLSKEMAIIFPFILLLMSVVFLVPRSRFNLAWHVPSFVLVASYGLAHHLFFADRYARILKFSGMTEILANYLRISGELLSLAVLPLFLHMRRSIGISQDAIIVLAVTIFFCTAAYICLRRYRRILIFSSGFFLIAVIPLVFVLKHFNLLAEHWLYLSSYGVLLFISTVFVHLYYAFKKFVGKAFLIVFLFGYLVFYFTATITGNSSWANSISLSDRVLEFSGEDDVALYYKVFSYLKSGEKVDMLSYAEKTPTDPDVWYLKGRTALIQGSADEAERDFKRILELDKNNFYGFLGLALTELVRKKAEKAEEYLDEAGRINPKSFDVFFLKTAVYSALGRDEDAFQAAEQAYRISPYDFNALINLGTAYVRLGRLQEGARCYFEASRLYPEKPLAIYNLGKVFYLGGQVEEAKRCLEEALMVDSRFKPAEELLRKIAYERKLSEPLP